MKNNILLAALASTTLLLSSVGPIGSSRALASEPTTTPAPAAVTINADPALWVIKDADTTIYLFGTVHVLKDNIKWFDGGVKAAYDASSEVVFELDTSNPQAMQSVIMKMAIDPDGPTLTQKLGPDLAASLDKALKDAGIPMAAFEKFEPWVVPVIMTGAVLMKAGYNPESGVETQLNAALKKDGKTLGALETAEEQMGFFDNLPEAVQIAYLKTTIADLPKTGPVLDEMVSAWAKGNPEALDALMNKGMQATPELEKVLLNDRNVRWADWVEKRMAKPGTVFMAVGAGHLAGKNSVQEKLKTKKLTATRIPS
jgi:uncharacterized protein